MWVHRQAGLPKYFRLKGLDQVKHKADFFCFFYSINPNKMSLDVTPVLTSCKTATQPNQRTLLLCIFLGSKGGVFGGVSLSTQLAKQWTKGSWFDSFLLGGLNTRQGNRYATKLKKKDRTSFGFWLARRFRRRHPDLLESDCAYVDDDQMDFSATHRLPL